MKCKIFGIPFLILLIFPILSFSKEVVKEDARKLAYNFYLEKSQSQSELVFFDDFKVSNANNLLYYIFNINDGFIIVAAADCIYPVIAYSFTSSYNQNNQPPPFVWWMDKVEEQITIALFNDIDTSEKIISEWNKYLDDNFAPAFCKSGVDPLMHLHWGQGCYYNEDFPADLTGPCEHAYVGCVATAMAQIIKHYNFPKQGNGTHGYNSTYGWLEVDYGSTFYDWIPMEYQLEANNTAVAELVYHAAVSINTIFLQGGSGAFDFDVRNALINYFNYHNDAEFILRDNYSGDWLEMLRTELDNSRPLLYGGADSTYYTGHTLVCDGYQDSIFFHFNWGWDGQFNGYYNVDDLTAGGYLFNYQQDVVIGIQPNLDVVPELYPPENITAITFSDTVSLSWNAPSWTGNLEFLGFNVFRDGQVVNPAIITGSEYIDTDVSTGNHNYYLTSVFIGAESASADCISVEVEGVGMDKIEANYLRIYPNPAKGFIEISGIKELDNEVFISIIDYAGRTVFTDQRKTQDREHLKIRLPNLSGAFLIQIESGNKNFTQKIILLK